MITLCTCDRCGGGRSAVFLAVDYCLKQLEMEDVVDIYSAVLHLRRFRKNMVRTLVSSLPFFCRGVRKERQTDRQTDRQRHRQRDRDKQTDRHTHRERETDRQTDRQRYRQRDRDKQTHTHTHT